MYVHKHFQPITRVPFALHNCLLHSLKVFSFLQMHLDNKSGAYFDYGNHTEKVSVAVSLKSKLCHYAYQT
jgi:hypothetical protein